jgi:V8-like Glu-specific endopeptidase
LALEVVLADDDRQQVTNTTDFPWRCICFLVITAQDGSRWVGSGWLANPRTVITAGHCVYLHGAGGWAKQIEVSPGRNGASSPFNPFVATDLRSVSRWTEEQDAQFDYGAILLPENSSVGFFGYASLPDAELQDVLANVYGYPADKQPGTLWGSSRKLSQVQPRTLIYNISTFGGQSGCPVFIKTGEERNVVGIHNYGDLSGNSATRITDDVYDDIEAWKGEVP